MKLLNKGKYKTLDELYESAKPKDRAMLDLIGLSKPIKIHIIKMLFLRDSQEYNHWKKELSTWIFDLSIIKLKPKNKNLKYKDLFNVLFNDSFETLDEFKDYIKLVNLKLENDYIDSSNFKITNSNWHLSKDFIREISLLISEGKVNDIDIINNTINKYFD